MCFAIAGIGIGSWLSAGAAVLGAVASYQQGQAEQQASETNARIMENNAAAVDEELQLTRDSAAIERRRLGERVAAERGALRAKFAGMGLDAEFGSPADLIGDVQRAYRIDADIAGRNEMSAIRQLDRQKSDFLNNANLLRKGGKAAANAGTMNAAGSFLGGAAEVSDRWIQPSQPKTAKIAIGA